MLSPEQIEALRAPFPREALSADTSRGFELTSIKAAYVIERLNDVFGPCGIGWRYVHSPFEMFDARKEVVTEVAFQYRVAESGSLPVDWREGWCYREGPTVWSEPVLACGGKSLGKGGAIFTDARKSAVTDGLTKAVSMIGVAHQVFKGQVRVGRSTPKPSHSVQKKPVQPGGGATEFWGLYNQEGKAAGISRQQAQALTANGDWEHACANLRSLISRAVAVN